MKISTFTQKINLPKKCVSSAAQEKKNLSTPYINKTPNKDIVSFSGTHSADKIITEKEIGKLKLYYKTEDIKIDGEKFTKYINSQTGSNPAFWASNDKSELYYVKTSDCKEKAEHLKTEYLASKLYNLAGIKTPKSELCKLSNGTTALKSEFIPNMQDIDKTTPELQKDFAADAWLANWDSLLYGNTFLKDGKSIKVDNGGALTHRAMGKLKTNYDDVVNELNSLIDGKNYAASYIYDSMTKETLVKSFEKVTSISDDAIRATVNDEKLAQTLINRKNYMEKVLEEIKKTPFNNEYEYLNDYMHKVRSNIS